ncbi:hypothetical protein GMD83_01770 [Pseudoflavonifractor sp. BIOML-A7]|nr:MULTISPECIES: hypothetical protein [unclassified Pseudoflavonifractor]MTR35351.1 hypothetical protein [Pseudoflavonifractor sp. BIOML-A9]MTR43868.1 hypothetical protein [Pseudoflavonifractor sp. BIOML-A13]MTS59320.1 hypothetical protein [Pseudoflavonifractor sp. BIOML-A7]MTS89781.1 hypothetical protein [Pseudoflavonifractor sp. BIOML-A4]
MGSAAFGRLHPVHFICSGGVNPPGIKIFAEGKNAWHAALAANFFQTSGLTFLSLFLGSAAFGGSTRFISSARAE